MWVMDASKGNLRDTCACRMSRGVTSTEISSNMVKMPPPLVQAVLQQFYGPLPLRKRRHSAETAAVQMLRREAAQVRAILRASCTGIASQRTTEDANLLR